MPCATDKECLARSCNISRHDVAGLANKDYHSGNKGVNNLSLIFIHNCGYQSFLPEIEDDVLPCYGSIQLLHKKIQQAWFNLRTLQSGPSVERILEKGMAVFPKLRSTTARNTVAFYESLQQVLVAYLIPLMPFNTICLSNNYKGLFPPGLGTDAYAKCYVAMLEILPRLLPLTDNEVKAKVVAIGNASCNGYDLLWFSLNSLSQALTRQSQLHSPSGPAMLRFSTSSRAICFISNFKPKRTCTSLLRTAQIYSFEPLHLWNMWTPSLPSKPAWTPTVTRKTMACFRTTSNLMELQ